MPVNTKIHKPVEGSAIGSDVCYIESNRNDRAFLGDGNQTRGSNIADSFFWCDILFVFSDERVLQTSPTRFSCSRRPMRHMLVTVFVFFDLASYVALTTKDPRPTGTKGMTDV